MAGCGGAERSAARESGAGSPPSVQTPSGVDEAKRTVQTGAMPSEREIKREQRGKSAPRASSDKRVAVQQQMRRQRVRPSENTAPSRAIELAERAARQWLSYRIDGTALARADLRKLARDVPPLAPAERVKGTANLSSIRAYAANAVEDRWTMHVSTEDARMATIVVSVARERGHYRVTSINAG